MRKETKKKMQGLEMKLYKKEVPENEIPKVKELIENLDARQQAIKIMINSIYGIIGTPHSPIYNIHMAQTITRTGKFCNISAAKHVAEVFNSKFGTKFALNPPSNLIGLLGTKESDKMYLISGDTDTTFFDTKIRIRRCRQ